MRPPLTISGLAVGRWRRITSSRNTQARTVGYGKNNTFPEPDSQMHMVYCCQNHSGSPALTAPVPKKALTPCATVYGFDAPLQSVWQTPFPTSHDVADVNASLHALKQLEHVQEEAAGMATSNQPPCLAANLTMGAVIFFSGGDINIYRYMFSKYRMHYRQLQRRSSYSGCI